MDEIIKAISGDGYASVSAISSKDLTDLARMLHGLTPVVTVALGRALAAASLIGSAMKKHGASLTVHINGGGPAGSIVAISDDEGYVRGFAQNPGAYVPEAVPGKPDVAAVVGKDGMLSVTLDYGGKEPHIGVAKLVSGDIIGDFTAYFMTSEQYPSVCDFDVLLDSEGTVEAAGGYVVTMLPGAPDSVVEELKFSISAIGEMCHILKAGGAEALAVAVMQGSSPRILSRAAVGYRCNCSRERYMSAILSLEKAELDDMKLKGDPIEACCQFCGAIYVFDPGRL